VKVWWYDENGDEVYGEAIVTDYYRGSRWPHDAYDPPELQYTLLKDGKEVWLDNENSMRVTEQVWRGA